MQASSISIAAHVTRNPAAAALYAVWPMSASADTARDPLERLGATVRYERNRTIYFEGDEAASCFRVRSGTVRLCKMTEDGRRQIAAFLTAGDVFGWVDGSVYNFSAEAVTDVTLEKFQRQRIDRAIAEDPAMGRRILALLSSQLADAHDHLLLLGRMTAYERIATFLLDLAKRQRKSGPAGGPIELPMNRRDLADYLGLTVETVSRVMNALKRKGVIFFSSPEDVELKQNAALQRLAMAA